MTNQPEKLSNKSFYRLDPTIDLPQKEHKNLRAIWNGEYRPPLKGEWYLSGAAIKAYRAFDDLINPYHIARIVRVHEKTTTTTSIFEIITSPNHYLYILKQHQFFDFTEPNAVNTILVRATTETEARQLATENEHKHRDNVQHWDSKHASCTFLHTEGESGVVLVA